MNIFQDSLRGPIQNYRRRSTISTPKKHSIFLEIKNTHQLEPELASSALESMRVSQTRQPNYSKSANHSPKKELFSKKLSTKSTISERLILLDHTKDQPDVIIAHLMEGKEYCLKEHQILKKWIYTLPQEIRMEVEKDKKFFPIPRNIDQKSITQGLNILYGQGKERRLRPGEEASIMETIRRYLDNSIQNPQIWNHSILFTLQQIIKLSGLESISEYPFCMKQIELHWKMMATRFYYSENIHPKRIQKFLEVAQIKGHFLDISKSDRIVDYLLKHAKK